MPTSKHRKKHKKKARARGMARDLQKRKKEKQMKVFIDEIRRQTMERLKQNQNEEE